MHIWRYLEKYRNISTHSGQSASANAQYICCCPVFGPIPFSCQTSHRDQRVVVRCRSEFLTYQNEPNQGLENYAPGFDSPALNKADVKSISYCPFSYTLSFPQLLFAYNLFLSTHKLCLLGFVQARLAWHCRDDHSCPFSWKKAITEQ